MTDTKTADAIVIGAGAIGAATAYFLARRGVKRVVLLDKGGPASGASGRSSALVRMHYTNPYDTRLALRSLEMFANWRNAIGGECGFHKTGFMCLAAPQDVEGMKENVEMLRSVGVNTWPISVEEAVLMQPFLSDEGLGAAAYEPDSGYADGWSTTHSLVNAAKDLGVEVLQATPATRLLANAARIAGVETPAAAIESDTVVLAVGAWSRRLAQTIEVELPLEPRRIAAAILQRPPNVPDHMTLIDMGIGFYVRPDGPETSLVGVSAVAPPQTTDPDVDDQTVEQARVTETLRRISIRIPAMQDAGWRRVWTGVDAVTPDGHMLLGAAPGVAGLYIATGGNGTGFKTAPAVGQAIAELITEGEASFMDISPFQITRFQEGRPIEDVYRYASAWPI